MRQHRHSPHHFHCLGGAEDIEPEHHPALDVLGDVAVRHPPSRVGRIDRMCTTSPARTRTVSFYTRFSSGAPPRSRTRKRPAPWMWNGWCIWWSAPAELSRRILTRSPTCSVQEISLLAAPVAVSTTFHTMLDRFDMTFISDIVSSHSMWS